VIGRKIEDIKLPKSVSIVAIVRDGKVIIAHHETTVQAEDHVILMLINRQQGRDIEEIFK
jgi:trk system potassium uptake protein TrkA